MVHGVTLATFYLIPMLGDKHPDEYPRFRDVYTSDQDHPEYDNHIHLYTRVGGGNRNCGYGEDELYQHPNYVETFDDESDCTYATYVFSVPEQWKADYAAFIEGRPTDLSPEYRAQAEKVFPRLEGKWPWSEGGER